MKTEGEIFDEHEDHQKMIHLSKKVQQDLLRKNKTQSCQSILKDQKVDSSN